MVMIFRRGYSQKMHINCIKGQVNKFGFCPISQLQLYEGPQVYWKSIPSIFEALDVVKQSGRPNFLAFRITVESQVNILKWRVYLSGYWDTHLSDLLEYGFPLDFCRTNELVSTEVNHASAWRNMEHVQSYIEEELSYKAILCHFQELSWI